MTFKPFAIFLASMMGLCGTQIFRYVAENNAPATLYWCFLLFWNGVGVYYNRVKAIR
jgi:hypothetical protein